MIGYKVIYRAQVYEELTLDLAAARVASFYPAPVRVRVRESLTRDRDLNAEEVLDLAYAAAKLLTTVPGTARRDASRARR